MLVWREKLAVLLVQALLCVTFANAEGPPLSTGPWGPRTPLAPDEAVVISGAARFTVISDRLLRMEYGTANAGGEYFFEDRATVAMINRNPISVPDFTATTSEDGLLTIETLAIRLLYQTNTEFTASTLRVEPVDPTSTAFEGWHYGQHDSGNLFGTLRTLDGEAVVPLNCTLVQTQLNNSCGWDASDCQCEWGVVSRDGWAVVDDTDNFALSDTDDWWAGPNTDALDIYGFFHGRDYLGALRDFTGVSGRIAMTPRHASGIWWTRWFDFDHKQVNGIVDDFRKRAIPLDIFVLDMNWHLKNDWTGYTFDDRLFPFPEDTLGGLKAKGLVTAANLHDASGVGSWEGQYDAMCDAIGRAEYCGGDQGSAVPFNITDQKAFLALEDIVLQDVEAKGMDFWWIDWQQGEQGYGAAGGKQNPTIWTAHVRSTDRGRRGGDDQRAMVLARWGGLGGHRYQVGFSGDVLELNWENLAFQPYFTLTASNVGFGAWSHDIVGPASDVELYTRWLQWGAHSGVMRNHDRGMSAGSCADDIPPSCSPDEPWLEDNAHFVAMRDAMRQREALLPYLYTGVREAFDAGVSLVRPMYYHYPDSDMAYAATPTDFQQYLLGEDLLVAPVLTPGDNVTGIAQRKIWIPDGDTFVERATGTVFAGGDVVTRGYAIDEVPVFVKAGAVVPELNLPNGGDEMIGIASRQYTDLIFSVYPSGGATEGSFSLYEDDGVTVSYCTEDAFSFTTASWALNADGRGLKFTVGTPQGGSFEDLPAERRLTLRIVNAPPAAKVTMGGDNAAIGFSRFGGGDVPSWNYEGDHATLRINLGTVDTASSFTVSVDFACDPSSNAKGEACVGGDLLSGVAGALMRAEKAKAHLDEARSCPGDSDVDGQYLQRLSSTGSALAHLAGDVEGDPTRANFWKLIEGFPVAVQAAKDEIAGDAVKDVNPARLARAQALLSQALEQQQRR